MTASTADMTDAKRPVPSVGQAAALIDSGTSFNAALLDVNLRGEMVFAIADALGTRGIPFAFVTGYERGAIPERYAQVSVFEKPIRPEEVAKLAASTLTGGSGAH